MGNQYEKYDHMTYQQLEFIFNLDSEEMDSEELEYIFSRMSSLQEGKAVSVSGRVAKKKKAVPPKKTKQPKNDQPEGRSPEQLRQDILESQKQEQAQELKRQLQKAAADQHKRVSFDLPPDWKNPYDTCTAVRGCCTSVSAAIMKCVVDLGCIDMAYIAVLVNDLIQNVVIKARHTGLVCQDIDLWEECFYKGFVQASDYLKGDIQQKWKTVYAANQIYNDYFWMEQQMLGGKLGFFKISELMYEVNQAQKEKERRQKQAEQKRKKEEKKREEAHVEEVISMELPMDWENLFTDDERSRDVHADSISDGLILSLTNLGCVDIEYIAAITGEELTTVIKTLKGSIYQNPETWGECFYKGWETADEYLSGNLMQKLRAAVEANEKYKGFFAENEQALLKLLPPVIDNRQIYVTLGSPWVPVSVIDSFLAYILGTKGRCFAYTAHDELTGSWNIKNKAHYKGYVRNTTVYGTDRIDALHIIEQTLNMKTVVVKDEVSSKKSKSGVVKVINRDETIAAVEKQNKLIEAFQKWVWKDKDRKKLLTDMFDRKFCCVLRRNFDGSFLRFPDMSSDVQLYPYQKDAVARMIFTPNTLLAHDVGSGKTYEMIAAGQEMRRMGLSQKNMYVVPNNITGQWKRIFEEMYPQARLLCIEPGSFLPSKRQTVLQEVRDGDFDGIVIAYSCFEQIPLSHQYYEDDILSQLQAVEEALEKNENAASALNRKKNHLQKQLESLGEEQDDDIIYFDSLGISRLFVDEAHNFKNVPFESKTNMVLGINKSGSKKCQDMLDKVRLIQKTNNGGGVVFATGTPITNSLTDAFIMQSYLQGGELALLDLNTFDAWIGMFAEKTTEFEVDVDTNSYRLATRFSRFHNLPELTALLSQIADFHAVDASDGIPEHDGYEDSVLEKTEAFSAYLDTISERADSVRKGQVAPTDDNMLKITTDGRKAALDLRLVMPDEPFSPHSKAARCAANAAEIYRRSTPFCGTQLIFCDTSTPKEGFNLYDEMKRLLTERGIPEGEIAFVHSAATEAKREKLFERVRNGEVRILIGSTFKLGLGVNIQNRLIALHHLDVPWRPADMTQREGRILRSGNTNPQVYIYRYITKGSFDAYSWQLLHTKQQFISNLLSGSLTERSGSDIDDVVLDYAQVKAIAVGNPLVKKRVEAANELVRYRSLQQKHIHTTLRLKSEYEGIPAKKQRQRENIARCERDTAFYAAWKQSSLPPVTARERKDEGEKRRLLREKIYAALKKNILDTEDTPLCSYRDFEIVLPAHMSEQMPYIWLQREGRYYVEMSDSEAGILTRIDNFLDELPKYLEKLCTNLRDMEAREAEIKKELDKDNQYTEKIEQLVREIEKLDKELGVKVS